MVEQLTNTSVLQEIRQLTYRLSPVLKRIAEYVLTHPQKVLELTVTELADEAKTSDASVIRFCKEANFRSFQELKLKIAVELARKQETAEPAQGFSSSFFGEVHDALTKTEQMIKQNDIEFVAAKFCAARAILVFGVGASGITASFCAYKLMRLGLLAHAVADPHLAAMTASQLGEHGAAFGISSSGSTQDTVTTLEIAKASGAFTGALTNQYKSPLTAYADVTFVVAASESPLKGGAGTAKIAQLALIEVLYEWISVHYPERHEAVRTTATAVTEKSY